jgi:cell volume regulation protein A
MSSDAFLILLGGLLVLAFLAEGFFRRFRIPPVLMLIACGVALGPLSHLLPGERFMDVAPHFGALAFLLILFEGGLDLDVRLIFTSARAGTLLALVGFAVAAAIGAALASAAGAAPARALVVGLVLAPISGAIILPIVGQLGLREEVRTMLVLEAALADVLAVLAMQVASTLLTRGGVAALFALGSLLAAAFSVLVAVAAGLFWPRVVRRVGDRRFVEVLTFGLAMLLWGLAELPGASGALAVLAFGVTLANERALLEAIGLASEPVAELTHDTVSRLHGFIGQLTFLVRAFFFVFLGVLVSPGGLTWRWYAVGLGLVGTLVVARRLVLDFVATRAGLELDDQERNSVVLLQPRGLVSAILAIEVAELGLESGNGLLGLASLVIVLTNVLLAVAARRGGLANESPSDRRGRRPGPP